MIGTGDAYKIAGGWSLAVPQYAFYIHDMGEWSPEN